MPDRPATAPPPAPPRRADLWRAWPFVRELASRHPRALLVATALLAVQGALELVSVLFLAPMVDIVIHSDPGELSRTTRTILGVMTAVGIPTTLLWVVLTFASLTLVKAGAEVGLKFFLVRLRLDFLRDHTVDILDGLAHARWRLFVHLSQGVILNTLVREVAGIGRAFWAVANAFSSAIRLLILAPIPLMISWQVTLGSFLFATLLSLPAFLLGRVSYAVGRRCTELDNRFLMVLQETVGAIKLILGHGRQAVSINRLRGALDQRIRQETLARTIEALIAAIHQPIALLVIGFGLFLAEHLQLPLSEMAVILYSFTRIVPLLGQIASQNNELHNSLASYEQVKGIQAQAAAERQPSGARRPPRPCRQITFTGVTFAHPGHPPVLNGVDLALSRGQMVAVVGTSGAGKSTLIDLLMGFHQPTGGAILVDGVPLEELDLQAYREAIGYVPQDNVLFNMSIRDNLTWALGGEDAGGGDEAALWRACRKAHAEDFIRAMPEGLDTLVGERGVRLSGGQVQRLALARALLRQPDLLILDEATSALDSQSERGIQRAIEEIAAQTTVVVIAHRLSTIRNADVIHVLDQGRVVESGAFATLIGAGGVFTRLAHHQELTATRPDPLTPPERPL